MINRFSINAIICSLIIVLSIVTPSNAETIDYEYDESSRSIMRVGPNQTLDMLLLQIYPDNKKHWPMIKEKLKELNPQAFSRYTGKLIPGQRLKLVAIKRIREIEVIDMYQVGEVASIKGYAVASDLMGKEGRLSAGSEIFEGDRVTTAKGAIVKVRLIDGAEMHIKPDSSIRISEYVKKSGFESGSRSIIDLIKGGLRKITGSIGANPNSIYKLNAGIATIGVRGTDYVVKLCMVNDCISSAGRNDTGSRLHAVVLDGVITVEDEEGIRGELALGQYAVATSDTKVIVDDVKPVEGLLSDEEKIIFENISPPEKPLIWPWILGGALFGL